MIHLNFDSLIGLLRFGLLQKCCFPVSFKLDVSNIDDSVNNEDSTHGGKLRIAAQKNSKNHFMKIRCISFVLIRDQYI